MLAAAKSVRTALVAAALSSVPAVAAEGSPFAGKVGARGERIATDTAEFYPYSFFGRLEYRGFETVIPYSQLRHTQNKRIFDGLGNTETIGVTDAILGTEWEFTDDFAIDGYYRFGIGASDYLLHEGSLAAFYTGNTIEASLAVDYARTSYLYPGSTISIDSTLLTPDAEVAFRVNKNLSFPIGGEYSAMTFSSSQDYGLGLGHAGVDWRITDSIDWLNRGTYGRDTSGYTVWGANTKARFKVIESVRLAAWVDYIYYTKGSTSSGQGKKALSNSTKSTSGKTNPLGSTDSFSYFIVGIEISYVF